jgi:actin-related protein 2
MNLRRTFYKNILISGGTSMIPGFPTRLRQDVYNIYKNKLMNGGAVTIKIDVLDPPTRKYNVFIGAAIQAKLS